MVQNIIDVRNLSKSFDISSKEPGLKGTIKHFLRRLNYENKNNVSELLNPINFFIWLVVSFKDIF